MTDIKKKEDAGRAEEPAKAKKLEFNKETLDDLTTKDAGQVIGGARKGISADPDSGCE